MLNGRDAIGQDEFALIVRAAFDSIPPIRKKVLLALGNGQPPYSLPESRGVVTRTLEDLASVGLVENRSNSTAVYRLSENANCLISQAGIGSLFLPIDSGGDISASIPPEKTGTSNCLED